MLSRFQQAISLLQCLRATSRSKIWMQSKLAPDSLFSKYILHGGYHHAQYNILRLNFTNIFSNRGGLNSNKYEVMWPVSQIIQIVISSRPKKSPHEKFAKQPNWRAEWKWAKREFSEKFVRGEHLERVRTKHGPGVRRPGPRTTIMDRVHGPPVMDRVHGHFVNFYRTVLHRVHEHSFLNSQSWTNTEKKKQTRFDETLSTDAHDWLQIFSCAYMTYTLLEHVQSQDC